MIYYIIATHREEGSSENEISHYKYFTNVDTTEITKTKSDFWNLVKEHWDKYLYYSYNLLNTPPTMVVCEWRKKGENGEPFLQSDPNGTQKDNLLELPPC